MHGMLERPPASQPGEFTPAQAIGLAMCCDCGKEIEEIKDDLCTGI
jgi:hypothetical protein